MKQTVTIIDDFAVAAKRTALLLRPMLPEADFELQIFSSAKAFLESLITNPQSQPWFVITDWMMPGMTGIELLQWLKRHPKYHWIPVCLLTGEGEASSRDQALKAGAWSFLTKPLEAEPLAELINKKQKNPEAPQEELTKLDKTFAEESAELIEECERLLSPLNEESLKELYRIFHTIKGTAKSLQFPSLAHVAHEAESLLTAITNGKLMSFPMSADLLRTTFNYFADQVEKIKQQKLLDEPPATLLQNITLFRSNVNAGWSISNGQAAPTNTNQAAPAETNLQSGVVSRSSSSVRITNERLDIVQGRLKKILGTKVRLSQFANNLQAEFFDETFPKDLAKLVQELNDDAMSIMEFFILLRVVPVTRIKLFSERVMNQVSSQLGKPMKLDFVSDAGLEIDLAVVEALEGALVHLIRNSIDHGIETVEERKTRNKPLEGNLKISIQKIDTNRITCTLEDDGRGINRVGLKAAVAKKNLMAADVLDKMSDAAIDELIFIEGLSTRTEVSDTSGRGVGMDAVKSKIQELGGTITVVSTPDKGTRFELALPRIFKL